MRTFSNLDADLYWFALIQTITLLYIAVVVTKNYRKGK